MARGKTPADTPLTKLFWSAHVNDLKQEFLGVKEMGAATAEEWLKGLDGRGKERTSDPAKWENWALANGLTLMRTVLYPGYRPTAPVNLASTTDPTMDPVSAAVIQIPGLNSTNNKSRAATPSISSGPHTSITPDPGRRSSTGTVSLPPGRQERTKEEVAELKFARKAEIERRALALDPPLPPNILAHIPSFQAALQIITPMDDQAWDLLKPRLLAQRADAEQRDMESAAQARRQQEVEEKRHVEDAAAKEARDAVDADWDEVQAPVRARIAGFADEIIRDGWDNGEKVDRNNCSKFAVEVLTYIRKRFYAEVAKDAAAARAAGRPFTLDRPQGPFTQKLTLENMKWIFDIKVKPHTERHRKEIFLCNGCDVTVKYYGFEGVIQHYAAKHTNALSSGNVVVHWRAEWPEHPPFTSEQKIAKNGYYQGQPPTYNTYQQAPSTNPRPFQAPPNGPTQHYDTPQFGEGFSQGSHPPYPAQSYGPNPYPPADPYHQPYASAPGHAPGFSNASSAPPIPPVPAGPTGPPGPYNYNYGVYQTSTQVGYQAMQPSPFSPQYRTQLEDMARIARELWNATSNMKDTLSIVRVQVVIHHLAKRFHARHSLQLPLSTFIDGLSNHKDMRPVRNVNGLICRVCHQGIGGYLTSEEERRSYSLPQLTAHFQSRHVEPFVQGVRYGQPPEWTVDMVMLPDPAAVSSLRSVVSMDGQKYHLVNEAVPHLLGPVSVPQAAPTTTPIWPGPAGYPQTFQDAPAETHPNYYGQPQTDHPSALESGPTSFHIAAPPAQVANQPAELYNFIAPPVPRVDSIPPVSDYVPPEPLVAAQSVALGRSNDNDRRSSQGIRQGREQNSRHPKKNKKKASSGRDSGADALKRNEDEEKMAEEEAEREGDAIRAMWAADRANAARKSAIPEGDKGEKPGKADRPRNASKQPSKPNTPQQRPRFQSRPPRNSPRRDEGPIAMDVMEPRFGNSPLPVQREPVYRGHQHQLSNVIYMDGKEDEPTTRDSGRTPEGFNRYDWPPRDVEQRRSRSPVFTDYSRPPPPPPPSQPQPYRQRSPPHEELEPFYQVRPPPVPTEDLRYNVPPQPRDEYLPRGYPDEPGRRQRAPEYIEYEIIEYRMPDGSIRVEERPLRRVPNPEPERYYRDAPPPTPQQPYDRGDPYTAAPLRRDGLPQAQPPVSEPYRPPFERAYSRAPQGLPPPPPQHPSAAARAYDPRHPSDAAPRQFQPPRPLSRTEYLEEYDPRYPAAPPSTSMPTPRIPRYQ